jgi:hypothetical protein
MDNDKIEILLNQLLEGQKDLTLKVDRIEKDLHSVVDQTANLTEFKTETITKLDRIEIAITKIEKVTKENCYDVAYLKAVK